MTRLSTIEIYKENMKFSAAHFTIFSDTHREHLHGHNYTAHVALTTEIFLIIPKYGNTDDGLCSHDSRLKVSYDY